MEDISSAKQIKNLMYRYMTPEVAEALLASGDDGLGGKRKNVSVLFSDIRSYTTLTEKLQAEEVVVMLNKYFEVMVDVVFEYGGTLDKYIGDALMAVFGSPAPLEDHAWCAMQTAVKMREKLILFNQERMANEELPISIGMGVHSDEVVSGNIGSSKRMELTSIGDGVNLASRLEGASKQYGTDLIISDNTYRDYADRLYVRELDFITVKGKSEPVIVYELVGIREGYSPVGKSLTETQQQIIEHYTKGREHYKSPVTQKLSESEVKNILNEVASMPETEIKKLSYKVDQQLEKAVRIRPQKTVSSRRTHCAVRARNPTAEIGRPQKPLGRRSKIAAASKNQAAISRRDSILARRGSQKTVGSRHLRTIKSQNQEAEALRDQAAIAGEN
jgi:class 3 adenylate cyclase